MGTHSKGFIGQTFFGSVAGKILQRIPGTELFKTTGHKTEEARRK
jgi:hypothetical protein